jgi:hypothetical protein
MDPCQDLMTRLDEARRALDEHRAKMRDVPGGTDEESRQRHEQLKQAVHKAERDVADCFSSAM